MARTKDGSSMSETYPYSKVTIAIETVDGDKTVYEIPKARGITVKESLERIDENRGNWPSNFLMDTLNIGVTLKADFDRETGRIYLETKTNVGRDVVDPKKAAIEAREARWKEFLSKYDLPYRLSVIDKGPIHPNHPDHKHEDCCK
jgi:hypothetical protein